MEADAHTQKTKRPDLVSRPNQSKTSESARQARKRYYKKNKEKWSEYAKKYRESEEGQLRAVLANVRAKARGKKIPFDLDMDFMVDSVKESDNCPVLGIPFAYGDTSGSSPVIERIDLEKGYTKDNCLLVSKRVREIRGDSTTAEMEKVLNFFKNILYSA